MNTVYLKFHGTAVAVKSEDSNLVENIRRDFSFFLSDDKNSDIKIEGIAENPDIKSIPVKIPFFRTRDALCYESRGTKYINYLDKALSIYKLKNDSCNIICEDPNLLHEITYITILSRIGERLDIRSIHRIHALGFTYKDMGILCMGSMYMGKTTLGIGLLKNLHVKLISDDTPLVAKGGILYPFPIRIGVNPNDAQGIPPSFCREITRKRFGKKVLVDIEYFYPDVVRNPVPLKFIFLAKRTNKNAEPYIKKANLNIFVFYLLKNMILARGIAQVKEYFIRKSTKDIFLKLKILISRIRIAVEILRRLKPYVLLLSNDRDKNAKLVLEFLEEETKSAPKPLGFCADFIESNHIPLFL